MFAAWFNQFLTDRFISPAANFAEYFADSVVKRELDPEREESLNATVRKLRGWSWVGPAAGFISFILAAIGACDLANTLDESSADKISICRPLERDMLTSSATHGESMERFKALGCGS